MLTRRNVLAMAIPVVLAQVATATTGLVDTAVMGRFGDKADLAAVAIASVAFSFIYWGFGFLRMSTTGLTAQANGRGDAKEVRAVLQRALLLGGGIGLAILAVSPVLRSVVLAWFAGTEHVESLASGYFHARVFGAPAYLMGLGITGWLLGTGRTRQMLAFQIVMNGVNVVLDTWFVVGLKLGPAGIGAGTAIAEWAALGFGLVVVRGSLTGATRLLDPARLRALLAANRDIMIRTLALVFCFGWFVRSGTLMGTAATAGNEVLLQFIAVAAFVLDGFAFVAEKEAGEAFGARDGRRLARAMRLTSEFAVGVGALFTVIYAVSGAWVIQTFIADEEARTAALDYLPWCAAVPLLGVAAWQLDGLFLGTTQGKALRTAGLITAVLYVATDLLLRPAFGNAGVWAAFLLMYGYRTISLGSFVPGLFARLRVPERDAI
ncbi:MATE family efflux transporter [Synoicihabitans lomoniglobus]|uniref:MATE family efflux transporter n=1 Tax=Synoicihabitans lomoniglobus TaxID=2909285 RepID=A0AAF0CNB6_9BACT|nr:MATE family efflux transporter [Opitutaceae bacterium LMO-M01]WED65298.1 MATE family efflux transporter [Opitutaceae bacterium LMO-M01]